MTSFVPSPAEEAVVGTRIDDLEADFPTVALALGDDPALSRWHPDHAEAFDLFLKAANDPG